MEVYKITNIVNGKIYVGQTTGTGAQRLAKHWSEAKSHTRPNNYFHNALLKYGIENFRVDVLDTADNLDELYKKEAFWIEELKCLDKNIGYNLMTGGKSGLKNDETKELLRQHKLENWKDEELAPRMRNGLRKATEKWIEICQERRVEFVCPVCGKVEYLQPHIAKQKKYCSIQCAGKVSSNIGLQLATKAIMEKREERNSQIREDIKQWIKEHIDLIETCPFNRISTHLQCLEKYMIEQYGIIDWRSISQAICDTSSRKELLKYLKSECEKVRCSGLK